jgi:hypothetical protein
MKFTPLGGRVMDYTFPFSFNEGAPRPSDEPRPLSVPAKTLTIPTSRWAWAADKADAVFNESAVR